MTKAKFYSVKFNRPDTLTRHRTKTAAIKKAGDFGIIYDSELDIEYQIHAMSNDTMRPHPENKPGYESMDFKVRDLI